MEQTNIKFHSWKKVDVFGSRILAEQIVYTCSKCEKVVNITNMTRQNQQSLKYEKCTPKK